MQTATRFRIATALVTAGCLLMMSHPSRSNALIWLASLFSLPRGELTRSVPSRELWRGFGFLVGLVVLLVSAKYFIPRSVFDKLERILGHPAFILPCWLLLLGALHRQWLRQKGEVEVT